MKIICLLNFFILFTTSVAALAEGAAAAGEKKFVMCVGCHGPKGLSADPAYPSIAGRSADFVKKQLTAFRSGTRESATMKPMASGLSDADIANLASFISSFPKP